MDMTSQPDGHATGNNLEHPTQAVTRFFGLIYGRNHGFLRSFISAANQRAFYYLPIYMLDLCSPMSAYADGVAVNLDVQLLEQFPGNSANGHTARRLPGAGPLQNRTNVCEVVLNGPCQVGVARSKTGYGLNVLLHRRDTHRLLPVLPVSIPY